MCVLTFRNNKTISTDGIQGNFLYQLRDVITWALFLLFNQSLQSSIFFSSLKLSKITPFLKSGNPLNIPNYRPISNLIHIAKLFEFIVLNSIYVHISIIY